MKTFTLLLLLLLASLDLRAQMPTISPEAQAAAAARRQARRAAMLTNNPAGVPPAAGNPAALGALPSTSPIITDPNAPAAAGANGAAGAFGTPGVNNNTGVADNVPSPEEIIPANTINFQGVDVNQVLEVYAKLVGRTLLRGQVPQASIILKTETALTKAEVIQALQAVLSLNGVALIDVGDKFVKVLPITEAGTAGGKFNSADAAHLPELGTYVTHIVQLKYLKPSLVVPLITPFSKLANAVVPIEDNGILVLRDNAENVKRMLEMIDRIDVSVPAEYISEVIPIKYAQASDIANALNSLGGSGGGSTVSIGSAPSSRVNGMSGSRSGFGGSTGGYGGSGGFGGSGGGLNGISGGAGGGIGGSAFGSQGQTSAFGSAGGTTANGTPATGSSFQQRLNSIISRAGGDGGSKQDAIQVFGQTKIIADQRSNALLVFATRADMENIKHVISQLDVLLAQVLIEAVIMDVNIGSTLNYGVSVVQGPQQYGSTQGGPIVGGGGAVNGPSLQGLLSAAKNGGTNAFGNNLGSGFSYFGNIGPNWDVAMSAVAGDNNATVIQRPRIQTSQAKPATFFVGNTVPYVTGTYYGGGYAGGNSSQYSQLSVGVELDVTPFINPDGLVVMDINQEIDDIQGYTQIDGNSVPNTDKRTLSSEIAVRSLDTIMMGGFIRTDKSKTSSGVPLLQDIPILGALFSNHSNSKTREELLVLMRPTVMTTPEAAAEQTLREERRLPGISAAAADDTAYERAMVAKERKAEMERAKTKGEADGFYSDTNTLLQTDRLNVTTNTPPPVYQFTPVIQSQPAAPATPAAPGQPPVVPAPVVPAQPVTPNQ